MNCILIRLPLSAAHATSNATTGAAQTEHDTSDDVDNQLCGVGKRIKFLNGCNEIKALFNIGAVLTAVLQI